MFYKPVNTRIPGDREGGSIADWGPVNSNVDQRIANFFFDEIHGDCFPAAPGYGYQNLNYQETLDVSPNPMMSSGFHNSDSSMNVAYTGFNPASVNTFNPQYFGGYLFNSNASTNIINNWMSDTEALDGRSRTVTHGGLSSSVAHSSAQYFHQQNPCHQTSHSMGFPVSANDVQPNLQNNPVASSFLGSIYNTHTSNLQMWVQMASPRQPGQWVGQLPVNYQPDGFKIPQVDSWDLAQGRPLAAEESSSHNCNDLNCNLCGSATFGLTSRKRKYHFGPFINESWSGACGLTASRKRRDSFEPANNESWVGSGADQMESKRQKCHFQQPSTYESWVGSDGLLEVLTNCYLPVDLPHLEQWANSSEDGSDGKEAMGNGLDGKEESSQLESYASSGTLMDVCNSYIKSFASKKVAMLNNEDTLGPKVDMVLLGTELSCEEKVICGFNPDEDDYKSVSEPMKSMKPNLLESEKTSSQITSFDDNRPEMELTNVEKPSTLLADNLVGNTSGSTTIKKQSASLADSFTASQIKEHLSSFIQPEKDISENTTPSGSQNPCQLCLKYKLLLAPTPVYCSSCDLRIKQNVKYYQSTDEKTKTQHYICKGCFKGSRGSTVITRGGSVSKANLHMAKNDEEMEDSWVQCDVCQNWQHRICGLYNNETDLEGKAEYVCPKCCLKEIENGTRILLPKSVVGAKDLPRTNLSDHIEQRLYTRMKQEREETAKFCGIVTEEVPVAEGLVVRVVLSVDKELEVKKQFRDIFHGQDYPEKIEYRSKLILLFQKIEGVDICLFGMYVQEFGSECNGPNNRCVYISYIDSVKYFQPERKTASGEPLRTFIYHEILIGYLEHCKKRGFASCYIWSCPLIKGEDYIFYCHPKTQKTPEKTKLRQWYKQMIKKAMKDGIVVEQTNLYNEFFIPSNNNVSAARLPYFDGDCWSEVAENTSKKLDEQESSGGKLCLKSRTKRILKANGEEMPTKDALVMKNLGEIILPEKENYMIVRLQHVCTSCNEVILSGSRWFCSLCNKIQLCSRCFSEGKMTKCSCCKKSALSEDVMRHIPVDTKDHDGVLVNKFFETRSDFLNKCQNSVYQFDTLGNAKYSSLMILHNFKKNLGLQPKDDTCHTNKLIPPSTEVTPEPKQEQTLNTETETLNRALDALNHASQCKSEGGCTPDCKHVKTVIHHASICTRGKQNGCHTCQGAWWILKNHISTCSEPSCIIPRCT
ncbi:hypothetical protein R6Q59_003598 [Mikania micrantha]